MTSRKGVLELNFKILVTAITAILVFIVVFFLILALFNPAPISAFAYETCLFIVSRLGTFFGTNAYYSCNPLNPNAPLWLPDNGVCSWELGENVYNSFHDCCRLGIPGTYSYCSDPVTCGDGICQPQNDEQVTAFTCTSDCLI